ncbi:hypothetical protein FRC02_002314 [Tulasnella sp. 418]|nr:hypothetical protein FRC02_002314 [Tulasnella sp. 418]
MMATPAESRSPSPGSSHMEDSRVLGYEPLIQPALLKSEIRPTAESRRTVSLARQTSAKIIDGSDPRVLVIVGPCSIHAPDQALEYANRLRALVPELEGLCVIMRTYFEKPRTTVGWKGLVNDPMLDGSFQINKGLRIARQLLCDITSLGLPVGCELLDTISPQYFADLISWGAIGARTTESQLHRELASGSSFPIGFKNGTEGSIQVAVDGIGAASHPHTFLGVTDQGLAAIVKTNGNPNCHVILRGGSSGPNFSQDHVETARQSLEKNKIAQSVMIDCSHANSSKDYRNQPKVLTDICGQISSGSRVITGVMIESNIVEGRQNIPPEGATGLKYGQSVTDGCVGWEDTVAMLKELNQAALQRQSL